MKILILANDSAGLYNFRNEVLKELLKKHKVYICLPDGHYIPNLVAMGCEYLKSEYNRHGLNPIDEWKLYRFYIKTIDSVKPDCVMTYTIKPNVYGGMACAKRKVPYIVNITGLGTAAAGKGLVSKIALILYKFGLRKAQRVFFQNQENFDYFVNKGISAKKQSKLIPGSGVNLERFQVLEYPLKENVEFAYVGRMMSSKGIDLYLEAATKIKNKYPNTVFHICGVPEKEWEKNMATVRKMEEQGIVKYHGRVENMSEIYKVVSCVIHPSFYPEGMSNVLLETCACGRPAITTNLPGRYEIIDNGVNGYLIKPNDAADLINKLEKFMSLSIEERKQMGLAGRKKVEEKFDRKIVIDNYLDELKRISKNEL